MKKGRIILSNKEILEMYYGRSVPYVSVQDIARLFGCKYKAAHEKKIAIQEQMAKEGKRNPYGLVPFDEVLKMANTSIELIEKNYTKQVKYKLGGNV